MSRKNGRLSRQPVTVSCRTCGCQWLKRRDSIKWWSGECQSCASKRNARRPEMRAIMRANGVLVTNRGPLPAPDLKNRRRGPTHYNWKGGITPPERAIYQSLEMRVWREAVLARDGFACKLCSTTEKLHTDHIKPLATFPELRFDLENGRTLCASCHAKFGAKVRRATVAGA